ncbi:MAG: hypothetical protein ACRC8S_11785 [Fimbriiglobus sp.]
MNLPSDIVQRVEGYLAGGKRSSANLEMAIGLNAEALGVSPNAMENLAHVRGGVRASQRSMWAKIDMEAIETGQMTRIEISSADGYLSRKPWPEKGITQGGPGAFIVVPPSQVQNVHLTSVTRGV